MRGAWHWGAGAEGLPSSLCLWFKKQGSGRRPAPVRRNPAQHRLPCLQGDVITGPRLDKVFASHVVLTDARSTSSTSGQATAAAFPADGFIKVGRARHPTASVPGRQHVHSTCCTFGCATQRLH